VQSPAPAEEATHPADEGVDAGPPLAPCVVLTGSDSAIHEERCLRVTSEDEWVALWLEHRKYPPKPDYSFYFNSAKVPVIDFATHEVLALFLGDRQAYSVACKGLERDGDVLTLRFESASYSVVGKPVAKTPFGFFVLPRWRGTIAVELMIYNKIDGTRSVRPYRTLPDPGLVPEGAADAR
jgi:hypothetical protein